MTLEEGRGGRGRIVLFTVLVLIDGFFSINLVYFGMCIYVVASRNLNGVRIILFLQLCEDRVKV